MRKFKKIALYTAFIFVVLLAVSIALAKFYEDDVKLFAIKKINENLTAQISVEEINLTLIERFPNASLKFKNVLLKDSINPNDTILFAENIFLKLDVWDLIEENFDVKKVDVENAVINLLVDEKGNENYHIWKQNKKDVEDEEKFEFSLENVKLNEVLFHYQNQINKQDYKFDINNLNLAGDFTESVFSLNGESNLLAKYFISNGVNYLPNQDVKLDVDLAINTIENSYRVENGDLSISKLLFKIGGFYDGEAKFLDLSFNANEIDLISLLKLVPEEYTKDIRQYKSSGNIDFSGHIKGKTSQENTPLFNANFEVENGSITEPKNDVKLTYLNLKGSYVSKNSSGIPELILNNFSGKFEDGTFKGSLGVTNFSEPIINLNASGNLNLNTFYRFLSSTKLEYLNGNIAFNGNFKANFLSSVMKIKQSSGDVNFSSVGFKFKDELLGYKNLSGVFGLKSNHAYITNLTGQFDDVNIEMDGYFRNFLPFILSQNETLTIEAHTKVDKADIKKLMSNFGSNKEDDSKSKNKINLNLRLEANQLIYGKLIADNVSSTVQIHDDIIEYQKLKFESAGGNISSSGKLTSLKNGNYLFKMNSVANQVNSTTFFKQLDDFGQDYLTHKNLTGLVDNVIDLSMELTPKYEIIEPSVKAVSSFNIKNGELINVSSINEMAEYIASDWKVKPFIDEDLLVKKAKHIKFKELQTNIIIKDEVILIPYTEIKSDLININGEGMHWFDDRIDYKFNFKLRDALVKADKNTEDEFGGYQVDDETGYRLFVRMHGTIEESEISLDVASKREQRKENLQQEKEEVKNLIKQEFARMKSDSTYVEEDLGEKAKFVIDWDELDEEEKQVDTTSTTDTKKIEREKKKKARMEKFLKKIGAEDNKDDDVQFKVNQ